MAKIRLFASLLALVLLLSMANPCIGASGREMVVVFKGDQTVVPFKENDGKITIRKPYAFRVPAFVGGIFNHKEFLVLFCDVHHNRLLNGSFIEVAARTSYGDYKTWSDAENVFTKSRNNTKNSVLGDLTAVMKDKKIFVLASSLDVSNTAWVNHNGDTGWDPLMFIGTVMDNTDSGSAGVCVKWDSGTSLKSLLSSTTLGKNGVQFIGVIGNGVVTKSGTIIFPVQIAHSYYSECVASIMYSTDDGSTWKIGGSIHYDPTKGSVTEWGDGKLLLDLRYDYGFRLIYESNDMGTTWKESTMFSWVWGNQPNRKGVGSQGSLITVPVEGKDVLLFSHPLNKRGGYKRDTLQLWMSDGQRIKYVGTISEDGKGERSGYSILAHVGDHLYIMHEVNPYVERNKYNATLEEWDRVIALSTLPDLFKSVKNTARAWKQVDDQLKNKRVPTNGLVGFLADSNYNNVWADEYNSVNANVNGATPVPGGFHFNGKAGSGAQWRVQSQGQNQLYIFTRKQFTLAATATIHEFKRYGNNWLLGASEDEAGTRALIGLGYTQDEGWYVVYSGGIFRNNNVPVELNKEYQLAITYDKGAFDVYVDGVSIMNGGQRTYQIARIRHIYIGGTVKLPRANGFECTVRHVLLYNRLLNKIEIDEIKKVEKYVHQDKPMINTEETDTVVAPTSSSAKQHTGTLISSESKPKDTLKDSKALPTTHNEDTTDSHSDETPPEVVNDQAEKQGSTEAGTSDTETPKSKEKNNDETKFKNLKHHSHGGDTKTNDKHVDGAVWTISFSAWMCLACSAIVLAGF